MVVLVISSIASGCVSSSRTPYTSGQAAIAQIDGFGHIRAFADAPAGSLGDVYEWLPGTPSKDVRLLAISGGGAGGAFTVGILSAWTKRGGRPEFEVVTGVSTGALIAPFAFLGAGYDNELTKLYIGGKAGGLVDINWRSAGVFGASLLKGEAIRRVVEQQVTPSFLAAIAAQHRKGRRLFVVTTNLDAQKAVTWNMGAIANSGRPDAVELFRSVLIASASIPGVFPAVMIKARTGSTVIEEMHSDGGSSMQFFTLPEDVLTSEGPTLPGARRFHMYVIINNALMSEFETVTNRTLPVMSRAYAVLVKSQTKQGLLALYNFAQRSKSELKVASIDQNVPYFMLDPFNHAYIQAVFARGYEETLKDTLWKSRPVFE